MEAGEPMMNRAKVQAIGLAGLVDKLSNMFDLSSDMHRRAELAKRSGIALEMKRALHEMADLLVKQGKLHPEAPTNGDTSHWVRYHSDDGFAFKLPYDGPLREDGITVFNMAELPDAGISANIVLDMINASGLERNRDLGELRTELQRVGREMLGAQSVTLFESANEKSDRPVPEPLESTLASEALQHPGRLFYCPDTHRSRRLANATRSTGVRQVVATATTDRSGNVLGHLEVQVSNPERLALADLTLVRMLAATAGRTLEDARNLEEISTKDFTTGLFNKRGYLEAVPAAIARAARSNSLVALMLLDVDHFKLINKAFGLNNADLLLKEIGRVLKEGVRQTDIVARWGGDEFVVVLTEDVNEDIVCMITERLRKAVEKLSVPIDGGARRMKGTISAGVAFFPEHTLASEHALAAQELFDCAEAAHFLAKQEPKNQIYFHRPTGPIHADEVRTRLTSDAPPRIQIVPPPPPPPLPPPPPPGTSARSES